VHPFAFLEILEALTAVFAGASGEGDPLPIFLLDDPMPS